MFAFYTMCDPLRIDLGLGSRRARKSEKQRNYLRARRALFNVFEQSDKLTRFFSFSVDRVAKGMDCVELRTYRRQRALCGLLCTIQVGNVEKYVEKVKRSECVFASAPVHQKNRILMRDMTDAREVCAIFFFLGSSVRTRELLRTEQVKKGTFRFVAFTLLMTSQYAQIGLDKLPNRINQCIDDLQVYKRDSDMVLILGSQRSTNHSFQRIRKLLIEDYQVLNTTITKQLSSAGHNVVDRVKKLTGAHVIDVFMNVSKG